MRRSLRRPVLVGFLLLLSLGGGATYLFAPGFPDKRASLEQLEAIVNPHLLPRVLPEPFEGDAAQILETIPPPEPFDPTFDRSSLAKLAPKVAKSWIAAVPKFSALERKQINPGRYFRATYEQIEISVVPALSAVTFLAISGQPDLASQLILALGKFTLWLDRVSVGTSAESSAHNLRTLTRARLLQFLTDSKVPSRVTRAFRWPEFTELEADAYTETSMRAKFWNQVYTMRSRADVTAKRRQSSFDELSTIKILSDLYIESMEKRDRAEGTPDYPVFRQFSFLCDENQIPNDMILSGRRQGWFADRRRRRTPNYFGLVLLMPFAPMDGTSRRLVAEIRLTKFVSDVRSFFDRNRRWPTETDLEREKLALPDPFSKDNLHWELDRKVAWSAGAVGVSVSTGRPEDRITYGGTLTAASDALLNRQTFVPLISAPPGPKSGS